MKRKHFILVFSFAIAVVGLRAQQPAPTPPPAGRTVPSRVTGISISSVAGIPFSATVVIETQRTMHDGSVQIRRTINLIARDSRGRTHNERRSLMPESFHGSPPLIEIRIFDPQTRIRTYLDPVNLTGRREVVPRQTTPAGSTPDPSVLIEDLGTTMLNGLEANGTRRTTTVETAPGGSGGYIFVVDEIWHSAELRIDLLRHHTDPRSGEQSVGLSAIKREEPPAAMFEVPRNYKIVDAPTPPASAAGSDGTVGSSTP